MSYFTIHPDPIPEKSTAVIKAKVVDDNETPIPGSGLTTMVYTLYDPRSGAIINSRTAVDCKSSVDAQGNLALLLETADTTLLSTVSARERRVVLFEWTYPTSKVGHHEVRFVVANLAKVT